EPADWWKRDNALDELIRQRFGQVHRPAAAGESWAWRPSAEGRLAEVIVLDQFSRNLFRDDPAAFAQDGMALVLAQEAIALGVDQALPAMQRSFRYMPFMRSGAPVIHGRAMALFDVPGMESSLDYERRHRDIIRRFGRYP